MSQPERTCASCGQRLEIVRLDGHWRLVEAGSLTEHANRCQGTPVRQREYAA